MSTRNHIITGGPGTGKTSIVNELEKRGWKCYGEVARDVIIQESLVDSDALPFKNALAFTEKVVKAMKTHLKECRNSAVNFFDRGLPDSAGYLMFDKIDVPEYLNEEINKSDYQKIAFIAPFWEEIYETDTQRIESADTAKAIADSLRESYAKYGFNLIEIPTGSVDERADFILNRIQEDRQ